MDYVEVAKNPNVSPRQKWRAWQRYDRLSKSRIAKRPRTFYEDDVHDRARRILEDELQGLGPQPSPARFRDATRRAADRLGDELADAFQDYAEDMYRNGMDQVTTDVGVSDAPDLSGFHRDALEAITEGQAETFAGFSRDATDTFHSLIEDAYQRGDVDPGKLVVEMIEEVGHEARNKLETIAHTETHKIHETARRNTTRDIEEDLGVTFMHTWGFIDDHKTCDVCQAIMDEIPEEGLPIDEIEDLIAQISEGRHPSYPGLGSSSWNATRDGFAIPHPRCFAGDMEVLTREGWKRFDECRGDEVVATLRSKDKCNTGRFQWQQAEDFIETRADVLVQVQKKNLDFSMTTDHEILYRTSPENPLQKRQISTRFTQNTTLLPTTSKPVQGVVGGQHLIGPTTKRLSSGQERREVTYDTVDLENWSRFLGVWLAEGSTSTDSHYYRTRIAAQDPDNREAIQNLLDRMPFNYSTTDKGFTITHKALWKELRPYGKAHEKQIPDYVFEWDAQLIEPLLEWYHKGDGSARKGKGDGNLRFYTTSKRMADDLQTLMAMCGKASTIHVRDRSDEKIKSPNQDGYIQNARTLYTVMERSSKHRSFGAKHIEKVDHDDKVYCFTVPNGSLLVRRGGKPFWTGNCRHRTVRLGQTLEDVREGRA